MTIAYVRTHGTFGNNASATTLVFPYAATVPVGNFVVFGIAFTGGAGNTISSIVDTKSNTYQVDRLDGTSVRNCGIVSCKITTQVTTTDTITVTLGTSATGRLISLDEYTGLHATTWLGNVGSATGTSTAPSSGNITTTQNDSLLYGVCSYATAGLAYTPGSTNAGAYAFTETNENKLSSANGLETEHYLGAATGLTITLNGTLTSAGWCQIGAIYLPDSAPIAPTTTGLLSWF